MKAELVIRVQYCLYPVHPKYDESGVLSWITPSAVIRERMLYFL